MALNRAEALRALADYVAAYDPTNPRIALKVAHTYRVAELCARIAPAEADLLWLCGLVHDIGRFEQVRRYDTFNDAASVSHAQLGAQILFEAEGGSAPLIRAFATDDADDAIIRTAVATHSDYRLPPGLDERTAMACDVVRDADKIDIIRVNCTHPLQHIYGVDDEAMRASELTDEVVRTFYEHRTVPRGIRRHPADILVSHLCFAWELVFPASVAILREQGYLEGMLSRTFDNPRTQETFEQMARHMHAELLA